MEDNGISALSALQPGALGVASRGSAAGWAVLGWAQRLALPFLAG